MSNSNLRLLEILWGSTCGLLTFPLVTRGWSDILICAIEIVQCMVQWFFFATNFCIFRPEFLGGCFLTLCRDKQGERISSPEMLVTPRCCLCLWSVPRAEYISTVQFNWRYWSKLQMFLFVPEIHFFSQRILTGSKYLLNNNRTAEYPSMLWKGEINVKYPVFFQRCVM